MSDAPVAPRIHTLCAVDIETLGTEVYSPIIQIGAAFAVWDADKEMVISSPLLPNMYWQFDSGTSGPLKAHEEMFKAVGISGDTLNFHFGQTTYRKFTESEAIVYASGQHLLAALDKRMRDSDAYIMAQNNEFDLAMLKLNSGIAFYDFRKTLDIRTFQCLGLLPKKLSAKTHNALEDAIAELEEVVGLLKSGKITLC